MKRHLLWVLGSAVAAVLTAVVVIAVIHRQSAEATHDLANELAMARQEGLPVTRQEFAAKYPLPAGRDAAPVYAKDVPRFNLIWRASPNLSMAITRLSEGKASAADLALIRLRLSDVAPEIEEMVAASKLPRCDFRPYPWKPGKPGLALDLIDATKLLAAQAQLLAMDANAADACEILATVGRIGRQMRQDHRVISELSAMLNDAFGMVPFRDALAKSTGSADLLARATSALKEFDGPLDFRALVLDDAVERIEEASAFRTTGDLAAATAAVRLSSMKDIYQEWSRRGRGLPLPAWTRDECEAKLVAAYRKLGRALASATNDPTSITRAVQAVRLDVDKDRSSSNDLARAFLKIAEVSSSMIGRQLSALQSISHQVALSIRLMQDHLRTGHYPASLAGYGSIAVDPTTGKPFPYRLVGIGFELGGRYGWTYR